MNDSKRLAAVLESFLFVAGEEGLTLKQLAALSVCTEGEVTEALDGLLAAYESREDSGITLRQYGGGFQLVTKAEFAEDMKRLFENPPAKLMTQAALEVLAIIAYKQPVTRVEVDEIRGVKSERAIQTLASKGFITEKGRLEASGRPILYATTPYFLDRFGLNSLEDLPPLLLENEEEEDTDLFLTKFQDMLEAQDEEGGSDA
ncbi:segregation and condensation protein B [Sporosarcina sp. NCCP-2716]|uniref:SMC-Scp complex subunit ScpB n=1 Tax=Sporosarcina sp. NCCP-2716 TaxID=2943679 RepID=UPI00204072DD|nr:SMC-Scp complex subunit ScpB [Sporosarcina sp. NCCP-2716]GKV67913.1 segregation and condensation protein B [Sporosarcina sp. NCCP-2716]